MMSMRIPFFKKKNDTITNLDLENMPEHVAIIMDGNGRWASKKGLPRIAGHKEGVDAVQKIVRAAVKYNINILTLYAFSTENWKRPKAEVEFLLRLPKEFRSEEHTSELQSRGHLVCRLLLEKKKNE